MVAGRPATTKAACHGSRNRGRRKGRNGRERGELADYCIVQGQGRTGQNGTGPNRTGWGVLQGASRLSWCADSPRNGSQSIRSNGFRSHLRHARGARGARGAGQPDSQTARQPGRPGKAAAASRSSAACTRLNCRTEATLDDTGRVRWSRDVL
jgi:hypothetical protein